MERKQETKLSCGSFTLDNITQRTVLLAGGKGSGKTTLLKMLNASLAGYTPGRVERAIDRAHDRNAAAIARRHDPLAGADAAANDISAEALEVSAPTPAGVKRRHDMINGLGLFIFDPLDVIRIKGFDRVRITRRSYEQGSKLATLLNRMPHGRVIISFPDLLQAEQKTFIEGLFGEWHPHDCVISIDEAHDFMPQSGAADVYCSELERAVRHWRNKNVGFIMDTQRPARLDKNVAELADALGIFRMTGNNDRAAVERIISGMIPDEQVKTIMADVPTLKFLQLYLMDFRA